MLNNITSYKIIYAFIRMAWVTAGHHQFNSILICTVLNPPKTSQSAWTNAFKDREKEKDQLGIRHMVLHPGGRWSFFVWLDLLLAWPEQWLHLTCLVLTTMTWGLFENSSLGLDTCFWPTHVQLTPPSDPRAVFILRIIIHIEWVHSVTPQMQLQKLFIFCFGLYQQSLRDFKHRALCSLGNRSQKPVEVCGKAKGSSTAAATGAYSWEEDATREVNSASETQISLVKE